MKSQNYYLWNDVSLRYQLALEIISHIYISETDVQIKNFSNDEWVRVNFQ